MSKKYLFDQKEAKKLLQDFFKEEKSQINDFGYSVNQTFEAFVFAEVIKWFKKNHYTIIIVNPKIEGKKVFKLKYSTRGAPKNYTYVKVLKNGNVYQIRHQLRVTTSRQKKNRIYNANICCDISIIEDVDLSSFKSDDALDNNYLKSFGEVKHMSAFAELIASFIGLVHELKPDKLKRIRKGKQNPDIIPCFLYVSGYLNPTAKGIIETIKNRKYDIDIYSFEEKMN